MKKHVVFFLLLAVLLSVPAVSAQNATISFNATFVGATGSQITALQNSDVLVVGIGANATAQPSFYRVPALPVSVNRNDAAAYYYAYNVTANAASVTWYLGHVGSTCPPSAQPIAFQGGAGATAQSYASYKVNATTPSAVVACYYPFSKPATNSSSYSVSVQTVELPYRIAFTGIITVNGTAVSTPYSFTIPFAQWLNSNNTSWVTSSLQSHGISAPSSFTIAKQAYTFVRASSSTNSSGMATVYLFYSTTQATSPGTAISTSSSPSGYLPITSLIAAAGLGAGTIIAIAAAAVVMRRRRKHKYHY